MVEDILWLDGHKSNGLAANFLDLISPQGTMGVESVVFVKSSMSLNKIAGWWFVTC